MRQTNSQKHFPGEFQHENTMICNFILKQIVHKYDKFLTSGNKSVRQNTREARTRYLHALRWRNVVKAVLSFAVDAHGNN